MASEWTDTTLGEVAGFVSGGTPSKRIARYWTGSIPWVSAKDMKRFRLDDTQDHLTEDGAKSGTKLVPADTVLLLTRGMTLLNDLPICVATRPMTFNQDVKALRPKPGVHADFLPYLLLGNKRRLLNMVDLAGHGTGRLNTPELKALDVVLPPASQQRAIARIFGALDDKIELSRRMTETLESGARVLFKSWFVNFDPVRAKGGGRDTGLPRHFDELFPDRFEPSELGEIPAGWGVSPLDKIATFLNGLALQNYPAEHELSLPVIKIAQLRKGNTEGADRCSSDLPREYMVVDGDVLFSWSGSLECLVWAGGEGGLNQHLFKVTSETVPKWFYYLSTLQHLHEFRRIAAGKATTMGHIQRHHLSEALVVVPDEALMAAADSILAPLLERVLQSHLLSRSLGAIRDALLPKLVSGELRLTTVEVDK